MTRTFTPEEIKVLNRNLTRSFESMLTKHSFKPGLLVRWKDGLKNKAVPEYNQPAIVWEVLQQPVVSPQLETQRPPDRQVVRGLRAHPVHACHPGQVRAIVARASRSSAA